MQLTLGSTGKANTLFTDKPVNLIRRKPVILGETEFLFTAASSLHCAHHGSQLAGVS